MAAVAMFVAAYAVVAFSGLCVAQDEGIGIRLDLRSGGALLLNALVVALHLRLLLALAGGPPSSARAFLGLSYDPGMGAGMAVLLAVETLAFFEYARFPLAPALRRSWGAGAGFLLGSAALALVWWADSHLLPEFRKPEHERGWVRTGPYRFVRHPRYLGLFLTRVALALMLGSLLAWLLLPGWLAIVVRRIHVEEQHLRERYGAVNTPMRANFR